MDFVVGLLFRNPKSFQEGKIPVINTVESIHPSLVSDYKSHKDVTTARILKRSAEPASCPTAT